jgi:Mg-chelatase subunit ChlD
MDCKLIALERESVDLVPCAIRIKVPDTSQRIPTHFILLLDVSESMSDDGKLANVKKCAEVVLQILTEKDRISLITFGEEAKLHLNRVVADESHKISIRSVIQGLVCDGCTNLSAGLAYVKEVCEGEQMKTGLLLLTDGHANRGVYSPRSLRKIIKNIHEEISTLSVTCVAYGSDHNADLLRGVAEDSQGTYTIVNSIEDTAMAFGDTLGGLLSCSFQNMKITVPEGSEVHGPYTIKKNEISIGDIYSGTSPLVLLDIPKDKLDGTVILKGVALPEFVNFTITLGLTYETERQVDVETTRLRYQCTSILKDLKDWSELSATEKEEMKERIDVFEMKLEDPFFSGNVLIQLLKDEVVVLRETLKRATEGIVNNADTAVMSQHITSIGLGRGFSTPMAPRSRRYTEEYEENPVEMVSGVNSVFQNPVQVQLSQLLRTASRY